jgi:hypothetical protein
MGVRVWTEGKYEEAKKNKSFEGSAEAKKC